MTTQNNSDRESVTITLTPDEQDKILISISATPFTALYNKLQFLFPNTGDLGRSPAFQSPVEVGQGGTLLDTPMNRVEVSPDSIF